MNIRYPFISRRFCKYFLKEGYVRFGWERKELVNAENTVIVTLNTLLLFY